MATLFKGHWQLLAITALVFALWQTPIVLPLKILVVYLHELSHGIAAVLTGGEIVSISVSAEQGGVAWTRGGSRFVTLSAGYLGSLLIGLAILVIALRTALDRLVLGAFGLATLLVTALYIREGFAILFCGAVGLGMLAAAWFLPRIAADLILRVIGLASLNYVPYDIFDDTISRAELRSDARMLAEEFGGTTMIWGGLWLILSLAAIGIALRWGLGRTSNLTGDALRR